MSARRVTGRIAALDRSAFPGMRGLPWWTAVLLAVALTLTGIAFDTVTTADAELGRGFTVAFFLGCVLAALLVVRTSLFAAGVLPPLLMTFLVPAVYVLEHADQISDIFDRTQLITIALPLISRFPIMAVTTVVVLAVVCIRAFLLEPVSSTQRSARRKTPSHRR